MTVFDINAWRRVPERISALMPRAEAVKTAHVAAADTAGILATSVATWAPNKNVITVYTVAPINEKQADEHKQALTVAIPDARILYVGTKEIEPNVNEEIVVKVGSLVPGLEPVWKGGNKLLGGPTPLSNGIMAGLLLGGLGYGGGALTEYLFPERYVQRGKLRRTLGLAGLGSGLGLGALNAYSNARAMKTNWWRGLLTDNRTLPPYMEKALQEKQSFMGSGFAINPGDMQLYNQRINVPQFNSMVWNDVQRGMLRPTGMHTTPQVAAAATGLMGGLSAQSRSPIISPATVIGGIASAGVGLATANLAGRALSALAGLTPAAQTKLQDMGLYAGMLHAIVPPLFGGR